MLEVADLDVYYGPVQALRGVSLRVEQGEIVTLVGANGAGKTTLLRALGGILVPARGTIRFAGAEIAGQPADRIVRRGIAHVPEGRRVFPGMTVIENLQVAGYALGHREALIASDTDRILALFPNLRNRARSFAWSLSGGEQQMLAIGRGLMAHPKLLLLDEPSLGLAPMIVEEVFKHVVGINREGTTVLLVEQNANLALGLAHRGYVLENGAVVLEGSGSELLHNPEVIEAYLGGQARP